jgi:hypothetical protein
MNTKNSNLLLRVAKLSLCLARKFMPSYSHPKSPHKFTQPQLMACLILRAYLKETYRGVVDQLDASKELRETLGLQRLPDYSTLKRFADRSAVAEITDAILADLAKSLGADAPAVAMDSTGLETTSASAYFCTRSGRKRKQYVKLSVAVLCGSLIPAGLVTDWGPRNDKAEAAVLMQKTSAAVTPPALFADAGYDAEWVHEFCRDRWGVASWIPPVKHRADGSLGGHHRSLMTARRLKRHGYSRQDADRHAAHPEHGESCRAGRGSQRRGNAAGYHHVRPCGGNRLA